MKYTGRVLAMICFILALIPLGSHFYYTKQVELYEIIFVGFILLITSWLGLKYDQFKYYSEKDTLTEVYNRRFIYNIFPTLIAMADRHGDPVSVTVIDIDYFKLINDVYGHHFGDQVLKQIAKTLTESFRKSDIIIRWGGDEFVIVAPYTGQDATVRMLERFQDKLGEIPLSIDISVSIGTAVYPDSGANTLESLIHTADQEMYRLKFKRDDISVCSLEED